MEEGWGMWEQSTLINELARGIELTKKLRLHLGSDSSNETRAMLIQEILSSFDKALLILKWSDSIGQHLPATPPRTLPESPASLEGSAPLNDDHKKGFNHQKNQNFASSKRKELTTWIDQVRICSENGLEANNNDGYSWRKYGQKDILGAKFPRSYYRCTYRSVSNCWATKQVQRSDGDPTLFDITYKGKHTCFQNSQSILLPPSPEKHEMHQQQQEPEETLTNLRSKLRVDIDEFETEPPISFHSMPRGEVNSQLNPPTTMLGEDDFLRGYPSSVISPAGLNSLAESSSQMNGFSEFNDLQPVDSADMIPTDTSATNSPLVDSALLTYPYFSFDEPGFYR